MNLFFGLILVIFNTLVLIKDGTKGIVLFVILSMVSPVTRIAGVSLSYDYLFLPVILIWRIAARPISVYTIPSIYLPFVFYFIIMVISTIVSAANKNIESVEIISIIGTFKYFCLFAIIRTSNIDKHFLIILRAVIFVNCLAMGIEYVLLRIMPYRDVIKLWIRLFTTAGNSGSLQHLLEFGAVGRLYGTFSSSAFPATLSILGIGCFGCEWMTKKNWMSILSIISALFIGVCSSSKRFYLGFFLILLLLVLFYRVFKIEYRSRKRGVSAKTPVLVLVFATVAVILYTRFSDIIVIDYYLSYLTDFRFIEAFASRFGTGGITNSMIPVIREHFLLGVGEVSINGINVTDSELFVVLYKTGLLGLLGFVSFFFQSLGFCIRKLSMYKLLCFCVVAFEFVISTEFFSPLGIFLIAYITTPSKDPQNRVPETKIGKSGEQCAYAE